MNADEGMIFLGKPMTYWMELDKEVTIRGVTELYREIASLRAKVSFYESRLDEIASFRGAFGKGVI